MARKKTLLDNIKDAFSIKNNENVSEDIETTELVEEDFLTNEETLVELSNGKGEDDELREPLADEQGE